MGQVVDGPAVCWTNVSERGAGDGQIVDTVVVHQSTDWPLTGNSEQVRNRYNHEIYMAVSQSCLLMVL